MNLTRPLVLLGVLILLAGCAASSRHTTLVTTDASDTATKDVMVEKPVNAAAANWRPAPTPVKRSTWPVTHAAPASGAVQHHPTYTRPAAAGAEPFVYESGGDLEARYLRALSGERPGNWNGPNARAAVVEPLRVVGGWVAMPVRMVVQAPWSTASTPN